MNARVSTLSVPQERIEEARRQILDEAVPAARGLPGRLRTVWLSNEASGTVLAVSMYDSEANLVANRESTSAIRERSARSAGGCIVSVDEFEVIAEDPAEEGVVEELKQVARRIYEEVINERRLDLLDELVSADYVEHHPLPGQREGVDGIRDRYTMLIEGLDAHFTIEDMIAEGDRVVVRWTNHGTNIGEFLGAPATNRPFSTEGIDIYRVENGKLAEHWHVVDVFGQMVQLGQLPAPGGA